MSTKTTDLQRREAPATPPAHIDPRQDPMVLGKVMAASGLFGDVKNENAAVVKVIAGLELGFTSLAAMTGIHIIEGKPVLGSNLMAALVKRSKAYKYRVKELTNEVCSLEFFERTSDGWEFMGLSEFTWQDAVTAGVASKTNWKRYPRNMLFARALSNGVGFYCPDLAAGAPVYTPEELDVQVDEETGEVAGDVPPAPLPDRVASQQGAKATAAPVQQTEPLITPAQQRKLWKEAEKAGIKDNEPLVRALILWAADVSHTDRIPKSKVDLVFDAVKDHDATVAVIRDKAQEGDELAQQIVQRFFGGDPDPAGDGGPEQPELA